MADDPWADFRPQSSAASDPWASFRVQPPVEDSRGGGVLQTIDNGVRQIAKGIPVLGGAMDSVAAAGDAATYSLLGRGAEGSNFSERYAKNLASEQSKDAAFESAHPVASTALNVGGAVAGTVPMAATAIGARALGLVGSTAGRVAQGALGGATIGAADSAVRGQNPMTGGGLGVFLGGASPVAGRLIGAGVNKLGEVTAPLSEPIRNYSRDALNKVSRAITDDSIGKPDIYGREGMLADLGPNLTSQAGAIANQPGAGQRIITQAIEGRRASAPSRVGDDISRTLGPPVNVIEAEQAIRKQYGEAAKPLYDQFHNSPVPFTPEMEQIQEVLKAQPDVLRKARQFSTLDGKADPKQFFADIADDGTVTVKRVPNATELDYAKRALDDYARNAKPGSNEARIYGNLAGKLRDTVDSALNPADPKNSIYAQARAVAGEGIGLRSALEEGQGAFSKGLSPDQMRADLKGMSKAERLAYALGGRNQVASIMGNSATAFGANGDTAARRALGSDYAREKLGLIAGDPAAQALIKRLDAETAFERTRQAVTQNSVTASRLQAQKEFPSKVEPTRTQMFNPTTLGILELLGRKGTDALRNSGKQAALDRSSADAARLLTAQDFSRDRLVDALLKMGEHNAKVGPLSDRARAMATILMQAQSEPIRNKLPR